jgi:DNA-binding transcriptional MocR family regulator
MTGEFADNFREGYDINLGVGYVNDKTIPAKEMAEALGQIINNPEKYRSAFNYGGGEGSPNLRTSIIEYYIQNRIGDLTAGELASRRLLIGADGATSLLDAFSDIISPGYVVTADPFYYIYTDTLIRKGFDLLPVDEDEKGIRIDRLEALTGEIDSSRISFFYIVTVNNPTSTILANDRRKKIVGLATKLSEKAGRKIPVIFDKAYEDIIHDPAVPKPVSGLKHDSIGNVFELGTLSKVIAPALRIGYLFSPDNDISNLMVQRTSDIGFSASLINQEIAGWLLDHYIQTQRKKVNLAYREKATALRHLFNTRLDGFLEDVKGGSAGFYFYLTFNNIETHQNSDFFRFLSRTTGISEIDGEPEKLPRLIYVPGTICSMNKNAKYQLRLSYGFEDITVFTRAVELIREACLYARSKGHSV